MGFSRKGWGQIRVWGVGKKGRGVLGWSSIHSPHTSTPGLRSNGYVDIYDKVEGNHTSEIGKLWLTTIAFLPISIIHLCLCSYDSRSPIPRSRAGVFGETRYFCFVKLRGSEPLVWFAKISRFVSFSLRNTVYSLR